MRRIFLCSIASLLLLSSCGWRKLTSQEVLQRATVASQTLRSARFDATGALETDGSTVMFSLRDGVLQDAGNQLSFTADLRAGQGTGTLVDVAILHAGEAYVRTHRTDRSLESLPLSAQRVIRAARGGWWRVALTEQGVAFVTPDPRLLRAQAEVISVREDKGIEQADDGSVYHYAVSVDPDALQRYLQRVSVAEQQPLDEDALQSLLGRYAATGDVWVDTHTFVTRRLSWDIRSADGRSGFRLDVRIRDVNAAPPVPVPQNAGVLSLSLLLSTEDPSLPTHAASGTGNVEGASGDLLPR